MTKWYLAFGMDCSEENEDVSVKYLHPPGPTRAYFLTNEVSWVKVRDILKTNIVPNTLNRQAVHTGQDN